MFDRKLKILESVVHAHCPMWSGTLMSRNALWCCCLGLIATLWMILLVLIDAQLYNWYNVANLMMHSGLSQLQVDSPHSSLWTGILYFRTFFPWKGMYNDHDQLNEDVNIFYTCPKWLCSLCSVHLSVCACEYVCAGVFVFYPCCFLRTYFNGT